MKPGQQLDVVVSSLGDAKSLKGGTLIQTPLRGADREVYAVAQGQLSIGGYSASGGGSSKVVNHTTVGRIPRGAIVEKEIHTVIEKADSVQLSLNSADAVTASRMVEVINAALQGPYASAKDPGLVAVSIPKEYSGRTVEFLSYLSSLEVERDVSARVIINERTGTVVVGAAVTLRPVAIAHGGITVEIGRSSTVSQPPPFSIGGSTIVTNDTELVAGTLPGNLHLIPQTATVADLVSALNAMGVKPNDLIVIFQALASAGAMSAELMIQ
jgi:flagellar P-ring protein precursor FlgI